MNIFADICAHYILAMCIVMVTSSLDFLVINGASNIASCSCKTPRVVPGKYDLGNPTFSTRAWYRHGDENMEEAFRISCVPKNLNKKSEMCS